MSLNAWLSLSVFLKIKDYQNHPELEFLRFILNDSNIYKIVHCASFYVRIILIAPCLNWFLEKVFLTDNAKNNPNWTIIAKYSDFSIKPVYSASIDKIQVFQSLALQISKIKPNFFERKVRFFHGKRITYQSQEIPTKFEFCSI